MSQINIDAQLVRRTSEKMIELSNGCICCTLREDLLTQLLEINDEQSCDYLVIESTGIAEPLHIAETFSYLMAQYFTEQPFSKKSKGTASGNGDSNEEKDQSSLPAPTRRQQVIHLDTMVTVVDLQTFLFYYNSDDITPQCSTSDASSPPMAQSSHHEISPEDRTLSHLLIDQIQFADVILLNKCDLVTPEQRHDIEGIIRDLNPHAKIIHSTFGQNLPVKKLINTKLFSFERAEEHQEWFQTEWGISSATPETVEYDISSITFQSLSRPFHPQRLFDFYSRYKFSSSPGATLPSTRQPILLRSKGFIWLPCDFSRYYLLHHTGGSLSIQPKDHWWICKDSELWPASKEFEGEVGYLLRGDRAVKYGDRGNTLILIGQHVSEEKWNKIREELNECLFSDEEMEEMVGKEENEEWVGEWRKTNPFKEIRNQNPVVSMPQDFEDSEEEEGSDDDEEEGEKKGKKRKAEEGEEDLTKNVKR
jgi:G3E family GTPase